MHTNEHTSMFTNNVHYCPILTKARMNKKFLRKPIIMKFNEESSKVFKLSHAHVPKKKTKQPRKQGLVKDQTHLVFLCWFLCCVKHFLCRDKPTKYKIQTFPCKAQLKQEKINATYFFNILLTVHLNIPYFSIDNAHPKLFRYSFWCIDNAHDVFFYR